MPGIYKKVSDTFFQCVKPVRIDHSRQGCFCDDFTDKPLRGGLLRKTGTDRENVLGMAESFDLRKTFERERPLLCGRQRTDHEFGVPPGDDQINRIRHTDRHKTRAGPQGRHPREVRGARHAARTGQNEHTAEVAFVGGWRSFKFFCDELDIHFSVVRGKV